MSLRNNQVEAVEFCLGLPLLSVKLKQNRKETNIIPLINGLSWTHFISIYISWHPGAKCSFKPTLPSHKLYSKSSLGNGHFIFHADFLKCSALRSLSHGHMLFFSFTYLNIEPYWQFQALFFFFFPTFSYEPWVIQNCSFRSRTEWKSFTENQHVENSFFFFPFITPAKIHLKKIFLKR